MHKKILDIVDNLLIKETDSLEGRYRRKQFDQIKDTAKELSLKIVELEAQNQVYWDELIYLRDERESYLDTVASLEDEIKELKRRLGDD